ncbi:MAG: hypothetical protein QME64_08225, partial [bacterium]|nr:hypothetical protein [bacterium]
GTGDFGLEIKKLQAANMLPPISVPVTHSFNTFLTLALSYGIWSVFVLLWLLWLLLKKGFEYRHRDIGFFILVYTLIFIIGSFTDMLLFRHQTGYLFALVVGLHATLNQSKGK